MIACEVVAQATQAPETSAGGLWIVVQRCDGHQAAQSDVWQRGQTVEELSQTRRRGIKAGFGGFIAEF